MIVIILDASGESFVWSSKEPYPIREALNFTLDSFFLAGRNGDAIETIKIKR